MHQLTIGILLLTILKELNLLPFLMVMVQMVLKLEWHLERYYEKYDTFKIENSGQQCQVVSRPIRKGDGYWEVCVRLIDNSYDTVLDLSACQPGDKTRWISNAMPELHEEGLNNAICMALLRLTA